MKYLLACIMIYTVTITSCSKNGNDAAQNLALLQHKWTIVFVHGEALDYQGMTGDYYNFATNNTLYISEHNSLDTMIYSVQPHNILLLYQVTNSIQSATAGNFKINNISNSALEITSSNNNPPVSVDISLSR